MHEPATPAEPPAQTAWNDRVGLFTVAACLVIASMSWYLLKEFAPVLRPLLLAVFLCYIMFPTHRRLTKKIPAIASMLVLALASIGILTLLALNVVTSASRLSDEMPQMIDRAKGLIKDAEGYYADHLPPWLQREWLDVNTGGADSVMRLQSVARELAAGAADAVSEAALVGIYLIFLLLEAGRIPKRIRGSFHGDRPDQILAVVATINEAMASYLRVKVKSSIIIAIPAALVLWGFGVRSPVMWGVLTFMLNFIPYLGSVIACSAPIALSILQTDSLGRPVALAAVLVSIHLTSAYVIEPSLTGKAINLSPIIILMSLAFWYLCWGLTGMVLAVPLTVLIKIILENVAFTQPFAQLMAEE